QGEGSSFNRRRMPSFSAGWPGSLGPNFARRSTVTPKKAAEPFMAGFMPRSPAAARISSSCAAISSCSRAARSRSKRSALSAFMTAGPQAFPQQDAPHPPACRIVLGLRHVVPRADLLWRPALEETLDDLQRAQIAGKQPIDLGELLHGDEAALRVRARIARLVVHVTCRIELCQHVRQASPDSACAPVVLRSDAAHDSRRNATIGNPSGHF